MSLFAAAAGNPAIAPVLLGVLLLIVVIAVLKARDPRRREFMKGLAKRLGGSLLESRWTPNARIVFVVGGRPALLQFFSGSKSTPPYTKVVVDVRDRSPGTLHILRDGFGQSFLKLFGAQDLKIGDAAFDQDYVVKATPESLAARVFSPDRRAGVIRTVERLRGLPDPTIDLDLEKLQVRVWRYLREERDVLILTETATQFLEFILGPGEALPPSKDDICRVCGTPLRDKVVRCDRPHHAECWAYAGHCSATGCPGTRARA